MFKIDTLTNHILKLNNYLNSSSQEVVLDSINGKLTSETELKGIDDRKSNYFYIRNNGEVDFDYSVPKISDCRTNLGISRNYTLVVVFRELDKETVFKNLISTLIQFPNLRLSKSYLTKDKIVKNEYPFEKKEMLNSILSRTNGVELLSFDFGINIYLNEINCISNPCKTC